MTNLSDIEARYRELLLGQEGRLLHESTDAPESSPARQRIYRRLVRSNLMGTVRRAVPILRKLAGDEAVDALIARFLDEEGPKTRLVRRIAGEWSEWLMAQDPGAVPLPHPAAAELAHWEVLEVEVSLAPEYEGPAHPRAPSEKALVESHPSARLAAYWHPVQALTTQNAAWPGKLSAPVILLAWRAQERFHWQRLEGGTAKVLVETAQGRTIGEAFAAIEAALVPGDSLDRGRVRADLVDLCRRGAIAGFPLPSS